MLQPSSHSFQTRNLQQGKPLDLAAIWRFMDNDTNGVARLATRIFSIIANSGATECNFSDFGNIQTKKRSRLSVDKTHKINVVRMDVRRRHAALGVLKTRGKRKLGHNDKPLESTTEDSPSDNEDEDFSAIAHNLIIAAIDNRAADEAEDHDPSPPGTAVPINTQRGRRSTRTQMPLATLFDFNRLDSGLDFYWTGAVKNLDAEADACEHAFSQDALQIADMQNASSMASTSSCSESSSSA
jgi:hypothetical protein